MQNDLTPMMQQYRKIRASLPANTILFFRLGDFYEMFFEDAIEASKILGITLTKRKNVPMCGVPYHTYELYLARLLKAGKKVAVCDQMEDPSQAKGIVRREVTGIVTPGSVLLENVLEASKNNYMASLYAAEGRIAAVFLDVSTGEFFAEEADNPETLLDHIRRVVPTEFIMPATEAELPESLIKKAIPEEMFAMITPYDDWIFEYDTARETLIQHYNVQSLEGFGYENNRALIGAAGAILHYIKNALHKDASHIRFLKLENQKNYMVMDEATRANLALITAKDAPSIGSEKASSFSIRQSPTLFSVLDTTSTAMGGRKLREWLLRPLINIDEIRMRHNTVEAFIKAKSHLKELRELLSNIKDIERILARLNSGGGNARDMRALAASLEVFPAVKAICIKVETDKIKLLASLIGDFSKIVQLIDRAIVEEPPLSLKEGGIIRQGFNEELDLLRQSATEGKNWLATYQAKEQERTGIKTLKVRYNHVFGYYIEISKGQAMNAPPDYIRKQTLTNAERFTTPELKEYEKKIVGAQERAMELEYEIFCSLREQVVKETAEIQKAAQAIAELDVLCTLAERALALKYVKPQICQEPILKIKDGRHPVIEQLPLPERFVPNDTLLDDKLSRLVILTGPNMAGKSTYIRQVALIVIMAQMGSFVPAASATIGIVDRLFTRVGAGDDIARGRSTFLVEMQETANILNNATSRSLVILDEIGRGTSTFDGISIAWAVVEHLHNKIGCRTLFATHYHELTDLALTLKGIKNYNVLVKEQSGKVAFLRKIVPGSADKSYGIHVAKLAGMPQEVIARAEEILLNLEEGEFAESGLPKIAIHRQRKGPFHPLQLTLFSPDEASKNTGHQKQ